MRVCLLRAAGSLSPPFADDVWDKLADELGLSFEQVERIHAEVR